MATVAGATAFKAICGSSPATAATFRRRRCPRDGPVRLRQAALQGIVASVGTLGVLMPPSVTLVVFGIITGLSIGKLFLAGLIPGLMIASFFILTIYGWCKISPSSPEGDDRRGGSGSPSSGDRPGGPGFPDDDRGIDEGALHSDGGRERRDGAGSADVHRRRDFDLDRVPQVGRRVAANGLHGTQCSSPDRPSWAISSR